jgi:biotin transport system substrate-specific component
MKNNVTGSSPGATMADTATRHVLTEAIWPAEGAALWAKRAVLVVLGIAALTVSAQIKVPVWPSPVLMNLGTFAVLTIAAAYGPRLGLVTMAGWLLIGALGFDVFQSSTADNAGLAYMAGPTGGYLVGYLLATLALGYAARRGWDRRVGGMAAALFAGNVLIYVPGLLWLGYLIANGLFDASAYASVWDQTLAWGLTPFLVGDALKLALAALLVPGLWKLVGSARG